MLNRLASFVDNVYLSDRDPKKIPAKFDLEGFGKIPYHIDVYNRLSGKTKRVVADDPNRVFRFVRASGEVKPSAPAPLGVSRGTAVLCALGAACGAGLLTAGALLGASWMVFSGIFYLVLSALYLVTPRKVDAAKDTPHRPMPLRPNIQAEAAHFALAPHASWPRPAPTQAAN